MRCLELQEVTNLIISRLLFIYSSPKDKEQHESSIGTMPQTDEEYKSKQAAAFRLRYEREKLKPGYLEKRAAQKRQSRQNCKDRTFKVQSSPSTSNETLKYFNRLMDVQDKAFDIQGKTLDMIPTLHGEQGLSQPYVPEEGEIVFDHHSSQFAEDSEGADADDQVSETAGFDDDNRDDSSSHSEHIYKIPRRPPRKVLGPPDDSNQSLDNRNEFNFYHHNAPPQKKVITATDDFSLASQTSKAFENLLDEHGIHGKGFGTKIFNLPREVTGELLQSTQYV